MADSLNTTRRGALSTLSLAIAAAAVPASAAPAPDDVDDLIQRLAVALKERHGCDWWVHRDWKCGLVALSRDFGQDYRQ